MTDAHDGGGRTIKLGRVEGDLSVPEGATILAEDGLGVKVTGRVHFDGKAELQCDFECESLEVSDGMIRVTGDLSVLRGVDVEDAIYVKKNLKADRIEAGGRVSVGGTLVCRGVTAGGSLEVADALEADLVEVGGEVRVTGKANIKDIEVGGRAEFGGGVIKGRIEVGGTLKTTSTLEFGSIEVGGTVDLGPGSKGKSIEVGGRLIARGDLLCGDVEVGGEVRIEGNFEGGNLEVGGGLGVSGRLNLSGRLEAGGSVEIQGELNGASVEVGGDLLASKAVLTGGAEIHGNVETRFGLKAPRIELSNVVRCSGPLVGGTVEVGKGCAVQDIFGLRVQVGEGSSAGKVIAEIVELEKDCTVDEVLYTKVLRKDDNVRIAKPPERASTLPPFPL